jgi:hypothetical protein
MLDKKKYCLLLLLFVPLLVFSQPKRETKGGASLSVELEKELKRNFSLSFEEEVRFLTNNIGFDRNVLSAGVDYSLFDKRVKVGAYYAFIYLYNSDYMFEPRQRAYFNLSYKEKISAWTLSWRGRLQGTFRDENRDDYRVNPRFVMKNKFEAEYQVFGKPWKPFLSCDIYTNLNDPITRYDLSHIRFQGGASWRLNRTTYLNLFLRWDEYFGGDDPRIVSIGATYKMKF